MTKQEAERTLAQLYAVIENRVNATKSEHISYNKAYTMLDAYIKETPESDQCLNAEGEAA